MTLPIPKLDDRNFQNLVDEAKKRIPHFTKEWTDHNVSDPGVTLIELFAWMTDVLLYRVNQVPDLHYVRLMELLGIHLQEPVPAAVPVTFWLSKPQETPVIIPGGTEISSTQTETESSIIFTTNNDFQIFSPKLDSVAHRKVSSTSKDGKKSYHSQNTRRLTAGFEGFEIFTRVPLEDDALYFGFMNDLSDHILSFEMVCDPAGGAGIDPALPPYIWEASIEEGGSWGICPVEFDTTKGMNTPGKVQIHLPKISRNKIGKKNLFWVRVRVKEISPTEEKNGMRPYKTSPRLRQVNISTWGGSTPSTHAQVVMDEFLGRSEGSPGERYYLQNTPILTRETGETVIVQVEEDSPQSWNEVHDFADSGSEDRHFTLDGISGEVRFGPAVRQPDGAIKLYGAIPPRGSNILFKRYRNGGGQVGNVEAGVINTLKTAIPYFSRVSNQTAAWGGLDSETLESAKMRVPALLRSRKRAVTESDFEFLAKQALPAVIGRVKCLQPKPSEAGRVVPGQVFVLVIPRLPHADGYLRPDQLKLNEDDITALTDNLNEHRMLTVRLDVRPPAYYWVSINVQLRAAPGEDQARAEADVMARLYRFLNPLTGGSDGKGWPFGRDLFASDVYQCLQGIPNVQFIRNVDMFAAQPTGEAQGNAVDQLEIVAHGVVASGLHSVEFV